MGLGSIFAARWAEVVFDEIFTTIVFKRGSPPTAAADFRRYIVALTVDRGIHFLQSLFDLSVLANGDWRNTTCVEVYVPHDMEFDELELRTRIAKRTTRALVPSLYGIMNQDVGATASKVWRGVRWRVQGGACLGNEFVPWWLWSPMLCTYRG